MTDGAATTLRIAPLVRLPRTATDETVAEGRLPGAATYPSARLQNSAARPMSLTFMTMAEGADFIVLADPEGNLFCVIR